MFSGTALYYIDFMGKNIKEDDFCQVNFIAPTIFHGQVSEILMKRYIMSKYDCY